jgi:hypothetical protein
MSIDNKINAATQAKKRWNAARYTAVKVSVAPDVAAAFKKACEAAGVSMAGKLTQFMAEFSNTATKRGHKADYSTRRRRRAAVRSFVGQIEQIRDAEEQCRDNTPENLQGSAVYEMADEYVALLDAAIEALEAIY